MMGEAESEVRRVAGTIDGAAPPITADEVIARARHAGPPASAAPVRSRGRWVLAGAAAVVRRGPRSPAINGRLTGRASLAFAFSLPRFIPATPSSRRPSVE